MRSAAPASTAHASKCHTALVVLIALCALVAAVPAAPAAADRHTTVAGPTSTTTVERPAGTPAERRQLEQDLAEATAEELRLGGQLVEAEAERARLLERLAEVEHRVEVAVQALVEGEAALGRATAALGVAQTRLRASEAALAKAIAELRDQAVESFMVNGRREPAGMLLRPHELRELGAAATYRDVVIEHQDGVVHRVTRLREAREVAARRAEAARRAASRAVAAAAAQREVVEAERAELRALEEASAAAIRTHAALLAEVQERKAAYEAELAALVQLSDSLAAALASRQEGQAVLPAGRGTFVLPVPTARLSSRYGPRIHPIFGTARLHTGMDMAAPTGTPVGAAGPGTVVAAGVRGGYGKTVVIDHGGGLSTLYAHLSAIEAEVGDVVGTNEVVGLVGSTGLSTGPHLHFEVRVFGTPVDPLGYL